MENLSLHSVNVDSFLMTAAKVQVDTMCLIVISLLKFVRNGFLKVAILTNLTSKIYSNRVKKSERLFITSNALKLIIFYV